MVLDIHGTQARVGGLIGPGGNGDDPIAKRLKAFSDIGVVKFSDIRVLWRPSS